MTDLRDLIERIERAEGPDREVDGDLWWRFCPRDAGRVFNNGATGLPRMLDHERPMPGGLGRLAVRTSSPAYTASLDDALALVEQTLPDSNFLLGRGRMVSEEPLFGAQILDGQDVIGEGESELSPALALCLALLRAIQAKEQS